MFYAVLAIAVAAAVGANIYDTTMTVKGIQAGVAVEKNTWLVGCKPTAKALYLRDLSLLGLASLPALIFWTLGNHPLAYGAIAGPVVAVIKHIRGGLKWKKLLN